ncbi:farnesyl pyrophosphate synthase [Musca domestica]|nr:farnesyl pyrophosphate synthase [Musca domestica]
MLNDVGDIIKRFGTTEGSNWFIKAIEYHLEKSACNILQLTTLTYDQYIKSKNISTQNHQLAYIMGYCTEFMNISVLMLDDIMDDGAYRRGHSTWYKMHGIGLAINDAFMIEHSVYMLLKHYFGHLPFYRQILETFHETVFVAACIQSLDLIYAKNPVNTFNMETYRIMAANKVAYDHFYLPFATALYLAGFSDKTILNQSKNILREVGTFYQIKNDYLDCYGTLDTFGKIGTDIQDNKYSWLVVAAMELANEQQQQIINECYGKKDPEKIQEIKNLYSTLDLHSVYAVALEESYQKTKSQIYDIPDKTIQEILLKIATRVYCSEM